MFIELTLIVIVMDFIYSTLICLHLKKGDVRILLVIVASDAHPYIYSVCTMTVYDNTL